MQGNCFYAYACIQIQNNLYFQELDIYVQIVLLAQLLITFSLLWM